MSYAGRHRHHRIYKLGARAPSTRCPSVPRVSTGSLPYASVSLNLAQSSYPVNAAVDTVPALNQAMPCSLLLTLPCYLTLVCVRTVSQLD